MPDRPTTKARRPATSVEIDYEPMTPCQVVAFNLRRARLLRDWTQEHAAERLEPYLGARWSKANWSAAERGVDGNRIRQFTADELFAFARGFQLPLTFFLIPPPQGRLRIRHLSGAEESSGSFEQLVFDMDDTVRARLAERKDWRDR
jgi:transcriptional regulator with XRE-family HTH domain